MRLFRKTPPIVLNLLQLRLAAELAAQAAVQEELHKQISAQLPGLSVAVENCVMDIEIKQPDVNIPGYRVVWDA